MSGDNRTEDQDELEIVEEVVRNYYPDMNIRSKDIRNSDKQLICREKFYPGGSLRSRSYFYEDTSNLREKMSYYESGFRWKTETWYNTPGKHILSRTSSEKDIVTTKLYDVQGRLHGYGAWTERYTNGNLVKFVSYVNGVESYDDYTW